MNSCPFCQPDPNHLFHQGDRVLGLWDANPVSPGHAMLTTRRHVGDWFSATATEQLDLLGAVQLARDAIVERHNPDGFNIGINVGEAAGQTVMHLHVHVIPRYRGDVPDSCGGGHPALQQPANCLEGPLLTTGLGEDHLGGPLLAELDRAQFADIAVSFVLVSGVVQIEDRLGDLLARGGRLRLITGDYLGVTDPDALLRLLDLEARFPGQVYLRVFEAKDQGFHPKAYLFLQRDGQARGFVGSSNLSRPALHEAVEWNYKVVQNTLELSQAFERLFTHF